MLDGFLLNFLLPKYEIIFLNGEREFAKSSYGIIYKCNIVGVDFIPFITSVEKNAFTTMNMEAMSCSFIHLLFIKLFTIHPTKAHGYMRWWNAEALRSMMNKCNNKSSITSEVNEENVKLFQQSQIRFSELVFSKRKPMASIVIGLLKVKVKAK